MYVRVTDNTPARYSESQLRAGYPNISFPAVIPLDVLAGFGVAPLEEDPRPDRLADRRVEPGEIVWRGGKWVQLWAQVQLSAEEIAEHQRATRSDPGALLARIEELEARVNVIDPGSAPTPGNKPV